MFESDQWDQIKKRWHAVWNNQIDRRCCVIVSAPKNGISFNDEPRPNKNEDLVKYWTDPEWLMKRQLKRIENTYYAGDAVPVFWMNLGAAGHVGYLKGSKVEYKQDTIWFPPYLESLKTEQIEFDSNSDLYIKTLEIARYMVKESKQRFLISMPDTSGNLDVLSHVRGSGEILLDMLDNPEQVKIATKKVQQVYERVLNEVFEIVKTNNDGGSSIGWLQTWAPGLHAQMQSDISVMISADMYKEFVMDELIAQCNYQQYPLYHFDGMEQIRHLDLLLSIEKLRMIQWTQVAGQPPVTEFIDVLKKIQSKGKGILIHVSPKQIEPLMKELSSKGLVLVTEAANSDEADLIVKNVEKWTH